MRLSPRRRCCVLRYGEDKLRLNTVASAAKGEKFSRIGYTVYMNPHATRKRNIFDPKSDTPFDLSRSKIELFLQCPRCFYLDRRLGVAPPRGFPFNLNDAVDVLLKKEFDAYREKQEPHPLVAEAGLSLVPMQHEHLNTWRDPFTGVRFHHQESNFTVFGGIDDVWTDTDKTVYIADYKATSKEQEVSIDADWQRSYKNQIEVYQWLFRNNGFAVSDTGYFVYANGDRSADAFDNTLRFTTKLIPYTGKADWIDETLKRAKETLTGDTIPVMGKSPMGGNCELCTYREAAGKSFLGHAGGTRQSA